MSLQIIHTTVSWFNIHNSSITSSKIVRTVLNTSTLSLILTIACSLYKNTFLLLIFISSSSSSVLSSSTQFVTTSGYLMLLNFAENIYLSHHGRRGSGGLLDLRLWVNNHFFCGLSFQILPYPPYRGFIINPIHSAPLPSLRRHHAWPRRPGPSSTVTNIWTEV